MKNFEDICKDVEKLSLKEKIKVIEGRGARHTYSPFEQKLESFMMCDGPHGVRKVIDKKNELDLGGVTENAICFPTASLTACSFDEELLELMGKTIGEEALSKRVKMILGPGVNIKRSPLCGRNFEYFSEDPFLSGKMGSAFIKGLQSTGVACSLKHFACNNQEKRRFTYSAYVSLRALHDIYLKPFEICVKEADPKTIMCSYNKVNGVQVCQNKYLLTEVLRDKWDFKGIVISDWGAVDSRPLSCAAGLDLEMPGVKRPMAYYQKALNNQEWNNSNINCSVSRVLNLLYQQEKVEFADNHLSVIEEHELAKKIATESMVLAKNEDNILPLNNKDEVLVLGGFAESPRYQGNGSSHINSYYVDNFIEILKKDNKKFEYSSVFSEDFPEIDSVGMNKAVALAKDAKKVVIFISLSSKEESEGYDRKTLDLNSYQIDLVNKVSSVNKNVIVVLTSGAPVSLPFIDHVKGLLITYLGGDATCSAIKEILYGEVNPSGKLAETWPIKIDDTPSSIMYLSRKNHVYYDEDIFVGYRHYQTKKISTQFSFGYGLSYSKFEESDFEVSTNSKNITVKYKVSNVSNIDGKYVGQVYIEKVNSDTYRCGKELKGFAKIEVKQNSSKEIKITISKSYLAIFDEELNREIIEDGAYNIYIGNSIDDIIYQKEITVEGEKVKQTSITPLVRKEKSNINKIFTMNSTIGEIKNTLIGKVIIKIGLKLVDEQNDDAKLMIKESLLDQPIRSAASFGQMSFVRATAIVDWANKKYFSAIRKLIFNR